MDLKMPRMDGHAALNRLRDDPLTAAIPTIVVTAMPLNDAESWLSETGATAEVPKPVDLNVLQDELARVLS